MTHHPLEGQAGARWMAGALAASAGARLARVEARTRVTGAAVHDATLDALLQHACDDDPPELARYGFNRDGISELAADETPAIIVTIRQESRS